jgi:hypothetical protein
MTTKRVSVVQKARYGVLILPVAVLLFSIWGMIATAFPPYSHSRVQDTKIPPSGSQALQAALYGLWTLWIVVKILQNIKDHVVISAEMKGGFAFVLGMTLMAMNNYFPTWHVLPYAGMAMIGIAATIVIITLVQGKSFGGFKLYHKDVQIHKNT